MAKKKILIFGNSGAGKSFLAQRLSQSKPTSLCQLDDIFWKPGGCTEKYPKEKIINDLDEVMNGQAWIIEGSYGDLIEYCVDKADFLIFLDLPWNDCEQNLLARGFEPSKWDNIELGKEKFKNLLLWSKEYWNRTDRFSYFYHQNIFKDYIGKKVKLRSRMEVKNYSL